MVTLIETIEGVRGACDDARAAGRTVGLVPTMGYLHEGHRSLMRQARVETDLVVVSIFVNPTQFGPTEDLAHYPRDLEGDLRGCEEEAVDVVFAPSVDEMYPAGAVTTVHVEGVTSGLCGDHRPGHFDGVTTIVAKLFAITGPCRAYFGRKDAQQVAVVTRMARDLDFPVDVVPCALVREADGLARSSRNAYLSSEDRRAAPVLFRGLRAAVQLAIGGERDPKRLTDAVREVVATEPRVELEYVEARDARTIAPVERVEGDVLLALAARVGGTRLIDNVGISVLGDHLAVDVGDAPTDLWAGIASPAPFSLGSS